MSAGSSEILERVLRFQDCELKTQVMQYDQHTADTLACMFYTHPRTPDLNDQLVINPDNDQLICTRCLGAEKYLEHLTFLAGLWCRLSWLINQ